MLFETDIRSSVEKGIKEIYHIDIDLSAIAINETRKDFEGDLTVVIFNLAKLIKQSPDNLGGSLGDWMKEHCALVADFNIVKGFLNLVIKREAWLSVFDDAANDDEFGIVKPDTAFKSHPVLVEYSSPNTNKPLHLGHVRNNLLGYSIAQILKATGNNVNMVNLVNDRGIHICKSMLAWQKIGNGETPASSSMKGDHLVGKYYVEFDKLFKAEVDVLVEKGEELEQAKKNAPIILEAQEMLRKWEANDSKVIALWEMMNGWVYDGFAQTYKLMGVTFDKTYYESKTYLLGKQLVQQGLDKGVFYKKEDGSVWVDLTSEGLDNKLLLRGDGTSVYLTQDLGTAQQRQQESHFSKLIYVVGNEQDYHFKVLRLTLKKLGFDWWDSLKHLSYAMVDLPSGKMKSREGTVVDADDLMNEMISEARRITEELGKVDNLTDEQATELHTMIGMGALKYFILRVDPEKRMLFNPAESIDFNGNTGPFIQYTHARIRSVIRKGESMPSMSTYKKCNVIDYASLVPKEKELIKQIVNYPYILAEAADNFSPAVMANYVYELAKQYNQFYHDNAIVDEAFINTSHFRLYLSNQVSRIIKQSMLLLGINVPERM
jgi:arginyl-tRNA synthetase